MQYHWFEEPNHQKSPMLSSELLSYEWSARDGEFIDEEDRVSRMAGVHNHSRAVYTGTDVSHELVYLVNESPGIPVSDIDSVAATDLVDNSDERLSNSITGVSLSTPVAADLLSHQLSDDATRSSGDNVGAEGVLQMIPQEPVPDMAELTSDLAPLQTIHIPTDDQKSPAATVGDKTEYEAMTRSASDVEPGEDAIHDESRTFHGQSIDDVVTAPQDNDSGTDFPFALSGLGDIASPLIDELLLSAEPGLFTTAAAQETLALSDQRFTLAELVGEQGESSWNTYSDTASSGIEMSVYSVPSVELDDMALLLAC
jgi:hypothetical protein